MVLTYVSPFAPKYKVSPHIRGYPVKMLLPLAVNAGAFAGIAGFAVIYYLEGVPRVQKDILQKVPLIGDYWRGREKPASDNPF